MPTDIQFLSSEDLQSRGPLRESILLCGRYGSGKTCAMISLFWYMEMIKSEVTCYAIDIEQKFRSALQAFGTDAPKNLKYRSVDNMNEAGATLETILAIAKPGDWVGIETMPRLWQGSQDLAYQAIEGVTKVEFLERKRKDKNIKSPIPRPDDFWPIANGSQYGDFLDLLAHRQDINIVASTTVSKPKEFGGRKESPDRKANRLELGIDFDIEGAPRMLSYIETICHLTMRDKKVQCQVLRDNLWTGDELKQFEVPDRKSWAPQFWSECRE